MGFPNISAEAVTNLTSVTTAAFTKVGNVTEQLVGGLLNHFVTRHTNATYGLAKNVTNIAVEGGRTLVKAAEDANICDFVFSNVTAGNTTTEVVSYDPADCGLYGFFPPIKYLFILFQLVCLFWSLFGNGCLLCIILTDEDMQEPGNIFLCALAIGDIAQTLMYCPSTIHSLVTGEPSGWLWCRIQAFLVSFLSCLTIYLQTGLLICRWVHISFPYHYAEHLASKRLAIGLFACVLIAMAPPLIGLARVGRVSTWALDMANVDIAKPVSLMLPGTPGGTESTVTMFLCGIGVGITCCIAALLLKVACDSENKHDQQIAWAAQADQLPRKLKAVKTFGIVVGVQWASWGPLLIVVFLLKFVGITASATATWGDITYSIMQTSTFTDSIVYAYRNNIYRKAMKRASRKIRNFINDF